MNQQRLRDIFAEELEKNGEIGLARMVRLGYDNSMGGIAAMRALRRVADEMTTTVHEMPGVPTGPFQV
jgi:hypothetical protein